MSQKNAKCTLELRHQRSCDVCFDWANHCNGNAERGVLQGGNERHALMTNEMIDNDGIERSNNFKPQNYMYSMIETMLPKAMVNEDEGHIRLLEM